GVGKVDGIDVCVSDAAKLVGKKVNVQVERVLDGTAYATLVRRTKEADEPITAESEAEKPTRRPAAKKETEAPAEVVEAEADAEAEAEAEVDMEVTDEAAARKKKTRRGTRGGRGRKKKTTTTTTMASAAAANGAGEAKDVAPPVAAKVHGPDPERGGEEAEG